MRFPFSAPFLALSLFFSALFAPAPASAAIEQTADNANTCALLYLHFGDTGPGYERLVARSAELSGRTVPAVRTDLAERKIRLEAAIREGRIDPAMFDDLATRACPEGFGIAPVVKRGSTVASAPSGNSGRPDPAMCAGLFRWLDARYPSNTWGTTWAGDEMVRRGASAAGLSYEALDRQVGNFAPSTDNPATLLDQAVRCQDAYDTPVPPGAVIAAAQHGDRPGIERGRISYCQALGNDFDSKFPSIENIEWAIARHPPSGIDQAMAAMKSLQWHFKMMDKANCPDSITAPRVARFEELTTRATNATNQAKARLEREGKWW